MRLIPPLSSPIRRSELPFAYVIKTHTQTTWSYSLTNLPITITFNVKSNRVWRRLVTY